ncbi:elongation factor EF-Ts [Candidatus Kinetoplastibacterium oncopeltii TCC290E]|uniref:Elongation factor Ts n=1 Tax=Candidatus Kinetoplastidibacterium stringomonadis TCC290E TaxID=1208920 RepID=M1M8I8_9PROT|nr:translation elongation factor Ts [Candidatus Kinetoplastibacterium oncopeltii]AGF48320.1 elongation factor EF-Ts [Candidatus Kinetoplastibacterium oncopeltii TCC290E]
MSNINASLVKELREKTDAPMMECKKALVESDGDIKKAEGLLRIKLGNKANKAASRVVAEGLIGLYISDDLKSGALIEVNCETDFVAKNKEFISFVNKLAEIVTINNPADLLGLSNTVFDTDTVDGVRRSMIGKIGENISIRRFIRLAASGSLSGYSHNGRIGVLVDHSGNEDVGKDVAMHIAAAKPKSVDASGVNIDEINSERSIALEKAKKSGKPNDIIEKIVDGSVQKFLKEVTLMSQMFVKDEKQTVKQMLDGKSSSVESFVFYVVGDGIEKKEIDFAAEVAAVSSM